MLHCCSMVPITVPGGLDTSISWRREKFVIDNFIWSDLEAAGKAARLAPQRPVKVDHLLPHQVCDVHVKTPDVSNIDVDCAVRKS